jgi:hypothetical protein
MAKLKSSPKVNVSITLELDEEEARALDALIGYGNDQFIKVFYEHMGTAYLKPHEKGLRTLFDCIRDVIPCTLARIDSARKQFESR